MRWLLALSFLCTSVWAQVPSAALTYRPDMIRSAWLIWGPGAPIATLAAQIHQESNWNINARSQVGAGGLAQFMPATAEDAAKRWPNICKPANPFNPQWAFNCRDHYLKSLVSGNHAEHTTECDEWVFGLRAYNGGGGWVARDRKLTFISGYNADDWHTVQGFNAGRSFAAFKENTEYPVRIFRLEARYAEWGKALKC